MTSEEKLIRGLQAATMRPTPKVRMARIDADVHAARTQQKWAARRYARGMAGRGEWEDWTAICGTIPEDALYLAVPSLLVRQARREAGVGPGPRCMNEPVDRALEALSYPPGDPGLPELHDTVLRWQRRLTAPDVPEADRFNAAVALLVVGPDDGVPRREELWGSGYVQGRAAAEYCDRNQSTSACLFDWSVFDNLIGFHGETVGELEEDPDEPKQACYTFQGLADMIDRGLWDDYVRRRQPRTTADTADTGATGATAGAGLAMNSGDTVT